MARSSRRRANPSAGDGRRVSEPASRDVRDWLREAAACLVDSSRTLPLPPHPDLQPAYESVLSSRQLLEQSRHDLIESTQMQSLQTVGSILAHDLHNLSLRLALLSQNLGQFYGDPAFLQSAKRILDDTVERMQGLVDGFRERQEVVIFKIPTDLNDLVAAVLRQVEVSRDTPIEVVQDYGETPPIWADTFFLASALRVLIQNAVDAMPEGGRLTVRTRTTPKGSVEVAIEDTGRGMTREFIERELFAPFRSGQGHGLGLGMYICQHIIELHDGQIAVESEPGEGTRFRLTFPKGPEQG